MRLQDHIDFTTLQWVKPELEAVLAQARQALEAWAEDTGGPADMQACADHLHQVQGTLRMLELYGAGMVAEEMETLARMLLEGRIAQREDACAALMRGLVQLPDYLERLSGGHRDVPVVLLPLLNELRAARAESALHESALFAPPLDAPLPPQAPGAPSPDHAIARRGEIGQLRLRFQQQLLAWFRGQGGGQQLAAMRDTLDAIAARCHSVTGRRLWWIAAGVLEGLEHNLLKPHAGEVRQLIGKVDRSIRQLAEEGEDSLRGSQADELARKLLYFVAQAGGSSPRLDLLRRTYRLDGLLPGEGELEHARGSMSGHNRALLDSVSRALKDDLLHVKDALDLFLRRPDADPASLAPQLEVLERVGDTLGMLALNVPRRVITDQRRVLGDIVQRLRAPDEDNLLDVAGALLYVEASLDDHIERLGAGEEDAEEEAAATPLPRSEARQIVVALMRESIANTGRVKDAIVAFVESGWQREHLADAAALMDEVAGGLRMLSAARPAELAEGVGRFIGNELYADGRVPTGTQLDQLADALAALEYYLEAVGEQRGSLDHILDVAEQGLAALGYWPPPAARELPPADELTEAAAAPSAAVPAAPVAAEAAGVAVPTAPPAVDDAPAAAAPAITVAPAVGEEDWVEIEEEVFEQVPAAGAATLDAGFQPMAGDIDQDIREIFLEEMGEEVAHLQESLRDWLADPARLDLLTPIRRSFHTLKGSGRLVGATVLGEFAWKIENLLNRVLDASVPPHEGVQAAVRQAVETLPALQAALEGGAPSAVPLAAIMETADRLAAGQADARVEPLAAPAAMQTVRRIVRRRVPRASLAAAEPEVPVAPPAGDEPTVAAPPVAEAAPEPAVEPIPELAAEAPAVAEDAAVEVFGAALAEGVPSAESVPFVAAPPAVEPPFAGAAVAGTPADESLSTEPPAAEPPREDAPSFAEAPHVSPAAEPEPRAVEPAPAEFAHPEPVNLEPVAVAPAPVEPEPASPQATAPPEPSPSASGAGHGAEPEQDEPKAEAAPAPAAVPEPDDTAALEAELAAILTEPPAAPAEVFAFSEPVLPPVDPVLLEILRSEVAQYLQTIRTHLFRAGSEMTVEEPLLRAVHTLHGALAMVEVPLLTDLLAPLEGLLKRLRSHGRPLSAEGMGLMSRSADAVEQVMNQFESASPQLPDVAALTARLAELRDAEPEAPAVPPPYEWLVDGDDEPAAASGQAGAASGGARPSLADELSAALDAFALGRRAAAPPPAPQPPPAPAEAPAVAPPAAAPAASPIDPDLLEVFAEEARELLDHADGELAEWRGLADPAAAGHEHVASLQRDLHTLKGGARIAGLLPLGDLAHAMETLLDKLAGGGLAAEARLIEALESGFDLLHKLVQQVTHGQAVETPQAAIDRFLELSGGSAEVPLAPAAQRPAQLAAPLPELLPEQQDEPRATQEQIRVRADLLDTLVNHAGEVAIYRSRLEQQVAGYRFNLVELEQTVARLRSQLRMLEMETEAQVIARYQRENRESGLSAFDPLELDRYSQLQQYSRALAESVSDLVSIQNMLDELTRQAETLLIQQSRVSSELQDGLLRTRMLPFDTMVPNLRRTLRQAAGDLGKSAQLYVEGAHGEMDRNLLDRLKAPFEHMLRNAAAHGIETPEQRRKAGKPEEGAVRIQVAREATEVVIRVADDGRGLDREAIRARALERGLIGPDTRLDDDRLLGLITQPGFSTAGKLTQLAGRGVGMDVVANEIKQLGGSLAIESAPGQGTTFVLRLPFTLAVTQAILVRAGEASYAIPMTSVQGVAHIAPAELAARLAGPEPVFEYMGEAYGIHELAELLGVPGGHAGEEPLPLLLTRAGDLRAAIRIDAVLGSREIVVKSVGPQVSSVPGVLGATIMGDGSVLVILDLPPLVRHGLARRRQRLEQGLAEAPPSLSEQADVKPLVMVVDDSITMRKVTSRVLERNEFEVATAKDGLDALEKLHEHVPDLILLDIEMPRMDGYELAVAMKADPRLSAVPVIMITSRTGEKHRQRAFDLGVARYLGKPYQEAELLAQIRDVLGLGQPQPAEAPSD